MMLEAEDRGRKGQDGWWRLRQERKGRWQVGKGGQAGARTNKQGLGMNGTKWQIRRQVIMPVRTRRELRGQLEGTGSKSPTPLQFRVAHTSRRTGPKECRDTLAGLKGRIVS